MPRRPRNTPGIGQPADVRLPDPLLGIRPSGGEGSDRDLSCVDGGTHEAFRELYERLLCEVELIAEMLKAPVDDQAGPSRESIEARHMQLKEAARIVSAVRVALSKGPDCRLDSPGAWARSVVVHAVPVSTKRRLAPAKDFVLHQVVEAISREGLAGRAEHPARTDAHAKAGRVALSFVLALMDERADPMGSHLVGGRKIRELTQLVQAALSKLDSDGWNDAEAVCRRALRAVGLGADEVQGFFSHRAKRGKRGSRLES